MKECFFSDGVKQWSGVGWLGWWRLSMVLNGGGYVLDAMDILMRQMIWVLFGIFKDLLTNLETRRSVSDGGRRWFFVNQRCGVLRDDGRYRERRSGSSNMGGGLLWVDVEDDASALYGRRWKMRVRATTNVRSEARQSITLV
ncbi:hypothetical protein Tco_0523912 [Tanacetum coccineum]